MKIVKPIELEVSHLVLKQKSKQIQNQINLQVFSGEIVAVTGENGAGKTTFLRTLCGLHREYEGEIRIDGVHTTDRMRRKESYLVMQDVNYELFANSVEQECAIGIKNPDYKLIDQTLQALHLDDFRTLHPNTLSGGQKQRVAIATSVVCGKRILAFDEPTSGLDYDSMKQVAGLMKTLAKTHIIFVVTHDYEFVCESCTRLIHFGANEMDADLSVILENESTIKQIIGIE